MAVLFWPVLVYIAWDVFKLFRFIRRNRRVDALHHGVRLVSDLYMLGVVSKFGEIGPDFLRWHVGDIGFPVTLMLLFTLFADPLGKDWFHKSTDIQKVNTLISYTNMRMTFLGVALAISIAYEVFAGQLVNSLNGHGLVAVGIGNFDWIDVAAYVLGASVAFVLLVFYRKYIREYGDYLQHQAAVKKAQAPKPAPRKYKKRPIKRGVR